MKYKKQVEEVARRSLNVKQIIHLGIYDFERNGNDFMDILEMMPEEEVARGFGTRLGEGLSIMGWGKDDVQCYMQEKFLHDTGSFMLVGEVPYMSDIDFDWDEKREEWRFSSCTLSYGIPTAVYGFGASYTKALNDILDEARRVEHEFLDAARLKRGI